MLNFKRKLVKTSIFVILFMFVVFFLVIPNVNTIGSIFWQEGAFTFRAFSRLLQSDRAMRSLYNSFILAPILSVTVGIVGLSLVMLTEYFKIFGAKILRLGYMTTLLYGGIILVSGYRFLYSSDGFLTTLAASIFPQFNRDWFSGFWGVLFVMTFAATGNHMIFIKNALRTVDFQTIEAAQSMGASSFTILRRVVFPVLLPSITAVTLFTFMGGLAAMAAPLLIGNREFQTISPMILSFATMPGSRDLAALLAMVLGLSSFLLIGVLAWLESRGHYLSVSKVKTEIVKQEIKNPILNVLAHLYSYILFLIYMAPVIFIILFSFTDSSTIALRQLSFEAFTLENYIMVFTRSASYMPLVVSTIYSVIASLGVAVLVLLLCRLITKYKGKLSALVEYAFMIPWLLPTVLIAMGLITTFNRPQWIVLNQVLTGTMAILVIGYLIIRIPFTLRLTRAAFFSVDDTLEDAAKNLGAKSFYTFFRIILPVVFPTVMAVFALNFIFLLTEFELSAFLYHPLTLPLGVAIRQLTIDGTGDNTAFTFVYAVIMMVISAVVLYLVYGKSSKEFNEF